MPVTEVRKATPVEPNHVYVIPANADLSLADGAIRVSARKAVAGRHLPIDHFFRTLAEAQEHLAIGVVLSGTASDRTLGLKAIKAAGGITFAQEPKSAKFDGMPKSALLARCVDFVLNSGAHRQGTFAAHIPSQHRASDGKKWSRSFRHGTRIGGASSSYSGTPREWTSRSTRNPRSAGASPAAWP